MTSSASAAQPSSASSATPKMATRDLSAWFGQKQVLNSVDMDIGVGEHEVRFGEPLPQPVSHVRLAASIGELTVARLGNASPREIEVRHRIGEVELDLRCKSRSASCERRLEEVEVFLEQRGSKVLVSFDGLSKRLSNKFVTYLTSRIKTSCLLSPAKLRR